jgi:hypothetical protein
MTVDDKSLQRLLEQFSEPREEFGGESYVTRRREWFDKPMESIRPLLEKDNLDKLTEEQARKIYDEMTVGGPQLYPRTFIENGIDKIRNSLLYLLYSESPSKHNKKRTGSDSSVCFLNLIGMNCSWKWLRP